MTKALLSHPMRPANNGAGRIILWVRKNLFSSWSNSLLTLFVCGSCGYSFPLAELGVSTG